MTMKAVALRLFAASPARTSEGISKALRRGVERCGAAVVLCRGYGLKMSRIHAVSHAAKVVQYKTARDRPYFALVDNPMGRFRPAIDGYCPVTLVIDCSSPEPTSTNYLANAGLHPHGQFIAHAAEPQKSEGSGTPRSAARRAIS